MSQAVAEAPATIQVMQPGMLTTVQDLGRPGLARFGVSTGGALDRGALILGTRLVDNAPDAAGLEITLLGPELCFTAPAVIALTGADLGARANDMPLPPWQPVAIPAGGTLTFRPGSGPGVRAYLCVAGGIAVEPVLGSRSTDLAGGFGGIGGRPLQRGDELSVGSPGRSHSRLLARRLATPTPAIDQELSARVVLGPQADRFTSDGLATFLGARYTVSAKADRTGVRLIGPLISHVHGADILSEGIAHGAIQVPGDGQPIVLLAARHTIGGYVKIGTVIGADLDRFAQLRPGDGVRFIEVTPDEARAATLAYWDALDARAVFEQAQPEYAREERRVDQARDWTPDGVVRVIEALRAADVSSFRIEVAGLTLAVRRDAGGAVSVTESSQPVVAPPSNPSAKPDRTTITAPVIGVFYRRERPDDPPLAEPGQHVDADQPIAVLEVMKTYHQITAPHSGTLHDFLVEDGQFVEYGQPIATMGDG
jgi:antagonist of KipI